MANNKKNGVQKLVLAAIMLLILPVVLAQVTCTDTDTGGTDPEPQIGEQGRVKYGLTEKADTCISGKAGYSVSEGQWIREYFCDNDQRESKDYDCTRYGFEKCEQGVCVGKEKVKAEKKTRRAALPPRCGDEIVQPERGEECERPDDICYKNDSVGICTRPNEQGFGGCKCKLYKTEEKPSEVEEEVIEEPEAPPEVAEEIPEKPEKKPEEAPEEVVVEEVPEEPEEELKPVGIGVTKAIANAVAAFFNWIAGLFS